MMTCGLFVELEAVPEQAASLEKFLEAALPLVRGEPGTGAWFAVKFRRDRYGILDVFPDVNARAAHLQGPVAQALDANRSLLAREPMFHAFDLVAAKLPATPPTTRLHKALFVRMAPHRGRERDLEELVRSTRTIVETEPDTTVWFGMRFENGDLGLFDAFADSRARRKHLFGKAPRELVKNFRLLGRLPRVLAPDVYAETFAP